ncbi:MAG: hypothetical protein ACK5SC_02760, partial [Microcystis sp.]
MLTVYNYLESFWCEQMAVQLQQALVVASYILKQRLAGKKRFPLVLMLEPLFRCNLACTGCG